MKKFVVEANDVNFRYMIRNSGANSLKQVFINSVKGVGSDVEILATAGINLKLCKGEVLGVIGKNGSGKSTLLKLLAGILPPSSGVVKVRGNIAPLIELGAGFNPELTGAENIVLFGVLLGNSRKLMEENLVSIADWAGLSDCIDLPLRTYSTGMQSRLGFSIATFQKSDLLMIDEVLSVGDAEFQKKCLGRIDDLIKEGEAAILVSHDLELVQSRSTKVIWLEQGRQMRLGDPEEVVSAYRNS